MSHFQKKFGILQKQLRSVFPMDNAQRFVEPITDLC